MASLCGRATPITVDIANFQPGWTSQMAGCYNNLDINPINDCGDARANMQPDQALGTFLSTLVAEGALDLAQYGCTDLASCSFELASLCYGPDASWCSDNCDHDALGIPVCGSCNHAATKSANGDCGSSEDAWVLQIAAAQLVKTGFDDTYRQGCCFGAISADDARCDPSWCPTDPFGSCSDLFIAECVGSSSCGRHKFLTPSYSSEESGAPCNLWYLSVKSAAADGQYEAYSPASLSTVPLYAIADEIARFCGNEGATSGECGCWIAQAQCTGANSGGAGCLIAADTGDARNVYRRADAYCNGPFAASQSDGSWHDYGADGLCTDNPQYGSPTVNPNGSNPYAPPAGVDPFPLHCWVPACQQQSDDCIFKNPVDLARACPPICLQFASGSKVYIDGTTTPAVHVNVNDVTCGTWDGVGAATVPPLAWPASEIYIEMPVGYMASFSVPIANGSQDRAHGFDAVTANLYSSLDPILTLPQAAANPVSLPNGATTAIDVVVDTGGLLADQFYSGIIVAADSTNANPPATLTFDLQVDGAQTQASVVLAGGDTLHPTVYPSTRTGPPRTQARQPPPPPVPGEYGQIPHVPKGRAPRHKMSSSSSQQQQQQQPSAASTQQQMQQEAKQVMRLQPPPAPSAAWMPIVLGVLIALLIIVVVCALRIRGGGPLFAWPNWAASAAPHDGGGDDIGTNAATRLIATRYL